MTDKKIIFQPGCFDDFEGTQEELDALVKEIETKLLSEDFESFEVIEVNTDEFSEDEIDEIKNFLVNQSVRTKNLH